MNRNQTGSWLWGMLATCALVVFGAVEIASAQSQAAGRAEANQLHAAIVNGDLESLRYWLDVRHADPAAPNDSEPDVTPIARCVRMAARVLDTPSADDRVTPAVGLRVLADMVLLLHQHHAQLSESERQRVSGPALRWYDDAISPAGAPAKAPAPPAAPEPAPPASTTATSSDDPKKPSGGGGVLQILTKSTAVVVTLGRQRCNGTGHLVYLTNHNALPISATVEVVEDATSANPARRTENVTVGPENTWELGCDASKTGRPTSYVLKGWR
jgi:hypothetical protein